MISIQPQQAPQFGRPKVTTQRTVLFSSCNEAPSISGKKNLSIINTFGVVQKALIRPGYYQSDLRLSLQPAIAHRYKVPQDKTFFIDKEHLVGSIQDYFKPGDEVPLVLTPYKKWFGLGGIGYKIKLDFAQIMKNKKAVNSDKKE